MAKTILEIVSVLLYLAVFAGALSVINGKYTRAITIISLSILLYTLAQFAVPLVF